MRNNTIQIAEEIPETKYTTTAAPDTRTVGRLLTHIAIATGMQLHIHGSGISDVMNVNFPDLMQQAAAEEAKPRTKAEIVALLGSERDKVAAYLDSLSDEFLAQTVTRCRPACSPRPRRGSRC